MAPRPSLTTSLTLLLEETENAWTVQFRRRRDLGTQPRRRRRVYDQRQSRVVDGGVQQSDRRVSGDAAGKTKTQARRAGATVALVQTISEGICDMANDTGSVGFFAAEVLAKTARASTAKNRDHRQGRGTDLCARSISACRLWRRTCSKKAFARAIVSEFCCPTRRRYR